VRLDTVDRLVVWTTALIALMGDIRRWHAERTL
jgi:hypothetical protein